MAVAQKLGLGEYCGVSITRRQAHGFVITENRFAPRLRISPHEHAHAHFTLVLDGGFSESYRSSRFECPAGTMLIVPADRVHTDEVGATGAHTLGVELSPKLQKRVDDATGILREPRLVEERGIEARALRLYEEFRNFDASSLLSLESLCMDLLVTASRSASKPDPRMPSWMPIVMDILHQEQQRDVSLADLSEAAGVHEAHLSRAFRRTHGCTVGEYVRWIRLEESKAALKSGKSTIAEIAVEVGFYDQAHFSRAFKRAYGVSPSAYRTYYQAEPN